MVFSRIVIDWNQIILLVIGAFITMVFTYLPKIFDYKKLNIFYRRYEYNSTSKGWGYNGTIFSLPIVFEFQNTSNSNKALRDISLYAYKDEVMVAKFVNCSRTVERNTEITKIEYGTENNLYSIVVPAKSVKSMNTLFALKKDESLLIGFNKIYIKFYDEKGKKHFVHLFNVDDCWSETLNKKDEDWIEIKY